MFRLTFRTALRTAPLLLLLLMGSARHASAQSFSAFFGVGTAQDKASGQSFDFFNGGAGPFFGAPKMTGAFGNFGAEFMITPHFGVNGDYTFRFSQGNYAGLGYRPTFFDFNGVYQPISGGSRIVPEFLAGLGAETTHFYVNQQFCTVVCQNVTTPIQNSSHFQFHFGGGVKFYVKPNIFLRPQIDVRWVQEFSPSEFGRDWVPEYSVAIGYTFGER